MAKGCVASGSEGIEFIEYSGSSLLAEGAGLVCEGVFLAVKALEQYGIVQVERVMYNFTLKQLFFDYGSSYPLVMDICLEPVEDVALVVGTVLRKMVFPFLAQQDLHAV